MRRGRIIAACTVAFLAMGATSVHAGEITGNGKDTPIRSGVARSICAFSGLNDDTGGPFPGRTQNWGQIPKELRYTEHAPSPGIACRGNN